MGSEYDGQRIIRKQKVDRISNLPDELLSHILSQLPAKWAVQTSTLSKRWEKLWTYITCLDFKNYTSSLRKYNVVDFTKFVGHVFRSYNPKDIQKLILHFPWYGADESSIVTWIDEWIKHKVNELDLYVYKFPLSVFNWTTLTVLTLGDCQYYDAEVVSLNLPFLKVLRINGRFSPLMEKLISGCPVLEDLTLGGSGSWYMTRTFVVSAHTLKTLRLQLIECWFYRCYGKISVEAPNLEYLHLSESFITYNIKGFFSSPVKAYLNIGHISKRRDLKVSKRHDFKDLPRGFALPNFASLTCLEVISCCNRFWVMLPKFIRSTPSLEVLSLEQKDGHDNVIEDEYDWVEPKYVAKCVRHHIGVIKVEGFKGRIHELQIVKYFLGSAKVLKTLTVRCQGLKQEEEIKLVRKLLEFSRASNDCKVKFHGNFISNL